MSRSKLPGLEHRLQRAPQTEGVGGTPSSRRVRYAIGGIVALVASYTFWALWFAERAPGFDELGLFNPAYMFARTGAVTYPIYPAPGASTAMFIHPPTHYFILGLLMRVHLPAEAAALVPVMVWSIVAVAAGMFCRFSIPARFAIATGVTAGIVMWAPPYYIRPDVDMAGTWIAGLIVLEGARLGGWNPILLGAGAFLLTLASALHYPMTPAFLGLTVYVVWMGRDLGLRGAALPLGALIGGALVPGIPYLVLFVIPHFSDIRSVAGGANGGFHPLRAWHGEVAAYQTAAASDQGGSLLGAIAAPFTRTRVPVAVAFVPFFLWRRDTRGIALACLPFLLFLTFFDTENHQLYATGEFTLYFIAVAYAVGLAVTRLAHAARVSETTAPFIAAAVVLLVLLVFGRPAIDVFGTRTSSPTHREMDIARAAGRVMGNRELVASFDASTTWYTTGGAAYYPLWRDISYQTDVRRLNLSAYLQQLPALAEANTGTAISSWAERGLVTARSFYFDWPLSIATRIRYIIYSRVPQPVAGVARSPHSAFIFTTNPRGRWEFVSEACRGTTADVHGIGPWSLTQDVPASFGANAARSSEPHVMLSAVAPPATIAHANERDHHCRVLRAARLSARVVAVGALLASATKMGADRTMQFPGWVPAVEGLFGPAGRLTRLDYQEPLAKAAARPGTKVQVSPAGVTITTPSKLYAPAAAILLNLPPDRSHLWIGLHVRVTKGTVGLCVLDVVTNACSYPVRSLLAPGSGVVYLRVPDTQHDLAVFIENLGTDAGEIRATGEGELVRAAPA